MGISWICIAHSFVSDFVFPLHPDEFHFTFATPFISRCTVASGLTKRGFLAMDFGPGLKCGLLGRPGTTNTMHGVILREEEISCSSRPGIKFHE